VIRRLGLPEPDWQALESILPDDRLRQARDYEVQMPGVELSSSDIRRRVAAGLSIRYRTPRAVEMYIRTHGLYRNHQPR
jgi:nicotinate-nucleotide adenylyltransferase